MKPASLLIVLSFATSAFAASIGERESGGGNATAAAFVQTGREALRFLSMGDTSMNLNVLLKSIKDTKVIAVSEICHQNAPSGNSYCEDAHYDAVSNTIQFSKRSWHSMKCKQRLMLSSHEFLRVAGIEGEEYEYSGRFLADSLTKCAPGESEIKCADRTLILLRKIEVFCEVMESDALAQSNAPILSQFRPGRYRSKEEKRCEIEILRVSTQSRRIMAKVTSTPGNTCPGKYKLATFQCDSSDGVNCEVNAGILYGGNGEVTTLSVLDSASFALAFNYTTSTPTFNLVDK